MTRFNYRNFPMKPLVVAVAASLSLGCSAAVWAAPANGVAASTPAQQSTPDQSTPDQSSDTTAKSGDERRATRLQAVVVSAGIRASEQRSVELKRNATSIQDSISAVDIGKLPDVTIADSLQRITGVQINRSGGEGSSVNVRGLPQVGTTLNGESFLTAGSIVSVQPNFTDIPSQLFSGADVIKSPTASLLSSGITGTINLRTRRPWDLESGWTVAGAADGSHGSKVDKWNPEANGLIGFNDEGKWGVLVSAAYSDDTLENSTDGMDQYGGKFYGENAASATDGSGFLGGFNTAPIPSAIHQLGGGNVDVNGNGNAGDAFYGSQNFTAIDRQLERKRLGINASAQADLGAGFTLTSDAFFTRQKQFNRQTGYQLNSASWMGGTFVPVVARDTGKTIQGAYNGDEGWNQQLYTTQVYQKWLGDLETYSENDVTNTISRNFNLQLDYDNGGNFTGSVRGITASAHETLMQSYVQFADADGTAWPNDPVDAAPPGTFIYPGSNRVFNPNGFAPNVVPVTVDMRGDHLAITLPQALQTYLSDPNNYALKTVSSEGNHERESNMNILRADGHYRFNDSGFKLDFGIRSSIRSASNINFNMVAPVYAGNGASDPNGCLVRWKAADVVLNGGGIDGACTAGNAQGFYRAGVISAQNPSQLPGIIGNNMRHDNGLAGVSGVSIYNLDPKAMDNPLAFQEALYPGEQRNVDPGGTWAVRLKERTAYLQADFDSDGEVPISGNLGLRMVRTTLDVTQHAVGDAAPYGLLAADNGTIRSSRTYTDYLPALNLAFDFTPELKLRLAYSKNMMPLNLDQWGGGLTLNYGIDTSTPGSTLFRVLGGNSSGNPDLDPWRSSNYDASLEYYMSPSTMVSVAAFYIDVDSFINNGSVQNCALPDQDGVVRNHCVSINGPVQGGGNWLHGFEFGLKQDFKFLPGIWSNFGLGANFTFSPSNTGTDLAGNDIPFQDNSKKQANLVVWYQDDKFEARVAGNYRSKRAVSQNFGGIQGMEEYQAPTFYVDASVSYKVTPNVEVYAQGSNLTNEHERYYLVWPDQVANTTQFERRVMLGVRAHF
ncbi:TonB-dependent receptor [Rhodanobacter sp. Root480]|uniref:TonB-dependent receptor n=1 Tax=Rhodanobacter sp. Root480 TaxID=1736542 RepID=UPI0006F2AEC8|nr:TonB-dependent receptor [Rhodanobacter sp. Root480]KQX95338.1 TonB-dependent receptor [Rhodanobacter sp. Root480]